MKKYKYLTKETHEEIKNLTNTEFEAAVIAYGSECAYKGIQTGIGLAAASYGICQVIKFIVKHAKKMDDRKIEKMAEKIAKRT